MPIYEYRCEACDRTFEELVRSSSEEIACPSCASRDVKRLLSVFSSGRDIRSFAGGAEPPSSGGGCGCTPKTCGCH
jgi:putative FmdB family regulatory protein